MSKSKKKKAPKLPRFIVPKDMSSKVFVDKKKKAKSKRKHWTELADEISDFS